MDDMETYFVKLKLEDIRKCVIAAHKLSEEKIVKKELDTARKEVEGTLLALEGK